MYNKTRSILLGVLALAIIIGGVIWEHVSPPPPPATSAPDPQIQKALTDLSGAMKEVRIQKQEGEAAMRELQARQKH